MRPPTPQSTDDPTGDPLAQPTRLDAYAALRDPNYRRFASGFIASSTGLQMLATGVTWEVYARTHDPLMLGLIGFARALPVLFLTLPAGHAADLFNRLRILISTQSAFALIAAAMMAASLLHAPIWVFLLLMTLLGCVRSFNGPARGSLLPSIVPPHLFENAVAWNSSFFQVSAIGGPILAGLIGEATGVVWPVYLGAAIGCALFALSASFIRPPAAQTFTGAGGKFNLAGMLDGMSHVWRDKTILSAITLDLFAVLLGGATALLPIYAAEILHVGERGHGILRSAPYVGALIMGLLVAHLPPFRRSGMALLLSVGGYGACMLLFGLSTWFPLSVALLALAGALDNVSVVIRHILVQTRTPDYLRGRVSAVNTVFIESSNELGAFRSGLVASAFGPIASVVSGGVGTILVVLGVAWIWPEVRRLGRLVEPAPATAAPPAAAAPDPAAARPSTPPTGAPSESAAPRSSAPAAPADTTA